MSLQTYLARAKSEEDVKDAYVKAFGLTDVTKGLVDIRTPTIWFEAKEVATPPLVMFGQLLVYVRDARRRGEPLPAHLGVVDRGKAALLPTTAALPALDDPAIDWPKSGSQVDIGLAAALAPHLDGHYTRFEIDRDERELIARVRAIVSGGKVIRAAITPDNLRQVFDKWKVAIGDELGQVAPADYATLFFADIMHDGAREAMTNLPARLLMNGDTPVFLLRGQTFESANVRSYRNFWAIYDRPPETRHRHYLLERRDSLLPIDEQKFKGAFYTPLHIVDKAYDYLTATLGADWQERYIVWDMCCGVGNLEVKHSNYRNVFMSTLDEADIDIMKANGTCPGVEPFQYDYLNDDVTDFGGIDYSLSNKVPMALRRALADAKAGTPGAKPILVLINPPYAEMTSGGNTTANAVSSSSKLGVTKTRFAQAAMASYGKAKNELLLQFIARVYQEVPSAILAVIGKLKYITTPTSDKFRQIWKADFLGGFAVHSRSFDSLTGEFPIGFLIWNTGRPEPVSSVELTLLDRHGLERGEKRFVNYDGMALLTDWVSRPLTNSLPVVPLKNAIVPATSDKDLRGTRWSDDALAWLNCAGNDPQNATVKTMLFSSGYGSARGFFVNRANLSKAAIIFAVRRLIEPTWINDRDQFLQPSQPLTEAFKSDCLVWMLFNGSNLTAGADGLRWNDRDWSLTNHFIPFTEAQVGAAGRFESDFMVSYMAGMAFSPEAAAVLDAGRALWRQFHATTFPRKIRDELKLGRADAGWYQVRRALRADTDRPTDFAPSETAYAALTAKLRPMVYDLGFLPR